ncbi:MAG: nucleotidyltransferase family protein [SAR324 cluster bacterium]|nr:nucleotidyltransferase family protein [SAR324 cluster bacterium]
MNKITIDHMSEIEQICRDHDINYLGVFGSYVRGESTEDSDLDLLVEFQQPKSLFTIMDIEEKFQKIFQKPIDLVFRKYLKERIKPYIMKDLQTIYTADRDPQ